MNDIYTIGLIISNAITFAFAVRGWYLAQRTERNIHEAGIVWTETYFGPGCTATERKVLPVREITHNRDDCMDLLLEELGYEFEPSKETKVEAKLKRKEE